jgi:hypothetical protein
MWMLFASILATTAGGIRQIICRVMAALFCGKDASLSGHCRSGAGKCLAVMPSQPAPMLVLLLLQPRPERFYIRIVWIGQKRPLILTVAATRFEDGLFFLASATLI